MFRLMCKSSWLFWQAIVLAILLPSLSTAAVPLKKADPPGLVLVPGAWHSPVHYTELVGLLSGAGYRVASQRLPSCNSANPDAQSATGDADAIRDNLILPQLDLGKEVVMIMHSYGGSPGSAAAKGLSLADRRAAGKPGGIIGLIVICGFLANTGQSLKGILPGGVFDPWVVIYGNGQLGVQTPIEIFYNDVPEPQASIAVSEIRNQSQNSLESPSGPPAWADSFYDGRRSYLHTLQDHGIPPVGQNAMLQASNVQWNIETYNTSHSPYLSRPHKLSKWIVGEIQKFSASASDFTATS